MKKLLFILILNCFYNCNTKVDTSTTKHKNVTENIFTQKDSIPILKTKEHSIESKFFLAKKMHLESYYSDKILYKLFFEKDSIKGTAIIYDNYWSKLDSFNVKGTFKDSMVNFKLYQKEQYKMHTKGTFMYKDIHVKYNKSEDNTPVNIKVLTSIPKKTYTRNYSYILGREKNFKSSLGSTNFKIDTVMGKYLFNAEITDCNIGKSDNSYGTANISLKITDKRTKKVIQTIKSNRPEINYYNNNYIFFDNSTDYNFDGFKDLTFHTGNRAAYGSFSRDVYLFNKDKNKFVLSREIEKATYGTYFELDAKKKWLIYQNKDGCSWHTTRAYTFKNNKMILVKSAVVDHTSDSIITIEKQLINNKMVIQRKSYLEAGANEKEIYKILDI